MKEKDSPHFSLSFPSSLRQTHLLFTSFRTKTKNLEKEAEEKKRKKEKKIQLLCR